MCDCVLCPFLNKLFFFFLPYPCCSFLWAGVRERVRESVSASRTPGHNSLGTCPFGRSMRAVRESIARKRSNFLLCQLLGCHRKCHLRRSLFRPFRGRCDSYERTNGMRGTNMQNRHNNVTLRYDRCVTNISAR